MHVKAGLPSEIYADGQNKVHIHVTFERIIRYTILECVYALYTDVGKKGWLSARTSLAKRNM